MGFYRQKNAVISFQEFCRTNPAFNEKQALEIWKSSLITPYCAECYFSRPERPFRRKRRHSYYSRLK